MAVKTTTSNVTQLLCEINVINSITFLSGIYTSGYPFYVLKNLSSGIMYVSYRNDFLITDDGVYMLDVDESIIIKGQGSSIYIRSSVAGSISAIASSEPFNPFKTSLRGGVATQQAIEALESYVEEQTDKDVMSINTNNLIPSSAYATATVSEVQVEEEDTYLLLAGTSLSPLILTSNFADYYFFKVSCRTDLAVGWATNIQVSSLIDGDWHYTIIYRTLESANTDTDIYFTFPVHPDTTQIVFTITAGAGQNFYFNKAIITEGAYSQDYRESPNSILAKHTGNPLDGLFILSIGDSLMRGVANNWEGFADVLSEMQSGICGGYNASVDGATVAYPTGITNYVKEQIDAYDVNLFRCDIALINGMVNECWSTSNISVGTVSEAYDSVFDTDTFCGALEEIFSYFKLNHPNTKLVYVTSHKVRDALTKLATWYPASMAVCEKWGVKVIDLYMQCQLIPSIPIINSTYFYFINNAYDACHFNSDGYDYINPIFEDALKTI
jgi:hypothetical protein